MVRPRVTYFWYEGDWCSIEPKQWDRLVSKVYEERKVPLYFKALFGVKTVKWPPKHLADWWVLDYPIIPYSDILESEHRGRKRKKHPDESDSD